MSDYFEKLILKLELNEKKNIGEDISLLLPKEQIYLFNKNKII